MDYPRGLRVENQECVFIDDTSQLLLDFHLIGMGVFGVAFSLEKEKFTVLDIFRRKRTNEENKVKQIGT